MTRVCLLHFEMALFVPHLLEYMRARNCRKELGLINLLPK